MSEYIGMSIEIGGELPAKKIEDLLTAIGDDLSDITMSANGPTTVEDLKAQSGMTAKWYGRSDYGECDALKAFCEKNKLSYVHRCDSTDEYDASIGYWTPSMKAEKRMNSDQHGSEMIQNSAILPYIKLLLALAKDGTNALPLFLNIEAGKIPYKFCDEAEELKKIVEIGLKGSTKKMFNKLEKQLNDYLPLVPTLPPLTIKE